MWQRREHGALMRIAQERHILGQSGDQFFSAMPALFLDASIPWHTRIIALDVEIDDMNSSLKSWHPLGTVDYAKRYLERLEMTRLALLEQVGTEDSLIY